MDRTVFEHLRVIRREYESKTGCSEVCEGAGGQKLIRLRIKSGPCQRAYLSAPSTAPVRLDRGVLEVLLPYRDGGLIKAWLEEKPDLGHRRDACLTLVAQCVERTAAPLVTALAARPENLRFSGRSAWLQLLPDWGGWQPGAGSDCAVSAVAALCRLLLTDGYSALQAHRYPRRLQLLCLRQEWGDYKTWGQLQKDLAAIPDGLVPLANPCRTWTKRLLARAQRWSKPAACIVVALLVGAALISLWGAYRDWRSRQKDAVWPGIVSLGDQNLSDG